jgi:SAM-dependent methyltransferase
MRRPCPRFDVREYDLIADWYAAERISNTGVPEVQAVVNTLPPGAAVLDLGCGNGIPITRMLVEAGFDVFGVDSSERMLARFQQNCPGVPFECASIQTADCDGRVFDAAVAWGVLFHLTHTEQRAAIANVSRVLKPGAPFLFTAGDRDGSIEGAPMNGVAFRYWSFSIDGYREILRLNNLTLGDVHRDGGQNTYYLATKALREY